MNTSLSLGGGEGKELGAALAHVAHAAVAATGRTRPEHRRPRPDCRPRLHQGIKGLKAPEFQTSNDQQSHTLYHRPYTIHLGAFF